jgi:hypothetical protein
MTTTTKLKSDFEAGLRPPAVPAFQLEANERLEWESPARARRSRRSRIWDFMTLKGQIKPEDTLVTNKDLAIVNMTMVSTTARMIAPLDPEVHETDEF